MTPPQEPGDAQHLDLSDESPGPRAWLDIIVEYDSAPDPPSTHSLPAELDLTAGPLKTPTKDLEIAGVLIVHDHRHGASGRLALSGEEDVDALPDPGSGGVWRAHSV